MCGLDSLYYGLRQTSSSTRECMYLYFTSSIKSPLVWIVIVLTSYNTFMFIGD